MKRLLRAAVSIVVLSGIIALSFYIQSALNDEINEIVQRGFVRR
jgi:hypothetical protein